MASSNANARLLRVMMLISSEISDLVDDDRWLPYTAGANHTTYAALSRKSRRVARKHVRMKLYTTALHERECGSRDLEDQVRLYLEIAAENPHTDGED